MGLEWENSSSSERNSNFGAVGAQMAGAAHLSGLQSGRRHAQARYLAPVRAQHPYAQPPPFAHQQPQNSSFSH